MGFVKLVRTVKIELERENHDRHLKGGDKEIISYGISSRREGIGSHILIIYCLKIEHGEPGFVLLATFYQAGAYPKKHGFLITMAICFTVSLAIEIVQAWLPSRSSSQMDLICNTAGSVIGIFMARWALKKEWIRFT